MTISQRQIHFTSIAPPGLVDDIVESYRLAAQELGHITTFAYSTVMPGVLNIVFFCWRLDWTNLVGLHPHCIVVNFEHLHHKSGYLLPGYRDILKHAYVWEYSETNFHRQRELKIQAADHVPLGYQQGAGTELSLIDSLPDDQHDIDVYFVGQVNERRLKILQQLQEHGLNVVCGASESSQRDAYLRRTKVALNMHQFDDSRIVETPRLNILFRNRKAVVCELYPDSELAPSWRNALIGTPYDDLVNATLALLKNPLRRAELEDYGYRQFRSMPQRPAVEAALARFDQWHRQQEGTETELMQGEAAGRVTVVVTTRPSQDDALDDVLSSLACQLQAPEEVLLIAPEVSLGAMSTMTLLKGSRHVDCPALLDRTSARNLGLALCQSEYIVFLQAGDICTPDRLQRQAAFLDRHVEIDIVGGWVSRIDSENGFVKAPELDHEIKANFLAFSEQLPLGSWMFRRRFLQQHGLCFDAQFDSHSDIHFLCRCAIVDARFAAIPAVVCEQKACVSAADVEGKPWLATGARRELLAAYFPMLTGYEVQRLSELYAPQWPADVSFASDLMDLLVKASESPSLSLNLSPATIRRALRYEAVRLVRLFADTKLIGSAWLDLQFSNLTTASFLAPASNELYPSSNVEIVASSR